MALSQGMSWCNRRVRGDARRRHVTPAEVCLSHMRAFDPPLGETFDSSFSRLTPGENPRSNAAIHGNPTDGAAANFGG